MLEDDVQLVSVDDHVIEHPNVWQDRLPSKFLEAGPRITELEDGSQAWSFENRRVLTIGLNAVAGKEPKDFGVDPVRFDEMLPGCYELGVRVADMDLDGVHVQMCFPSFPGFAGSTFFAAEDKALATACVAAWNDFIIDEWCAGAPGRFIPMVMVPFWDVPASVAEVQRTASKGRRQSPLLKLLTASACLPFTPTIGIRCLLPHRIHKCRCVCTSARAVRLRLLLMQTSQFRSHCSE